ncbi:hypothetical protein BX666DRAFT_1975085 [Dichotomocladium elegans]|nr:hypothetical protein BX666DRAFT_1975085 [Dichotomocladium elegans]
MVYSITPRLKRWHCSATVVLLAWLVLALTTSIAIAGEPEKNSTSDAGCTPSNCVAKCNPGCASDQICVLGTMTTCGICPISTCYHRDLISGSSTNNNDNSNSNDSASSNDKGRLIGGIVGGLVGTGLVVSAIGYSCFRYKQRRKEKSTLPISYTGKTMSQALPPPSPSEQAQRRETRQVSGMIPVTYVPPRPTSSVEQQQRDYDHAIRSSLLQNRSNRSIKHISTASNPFSDCNRTVMDDDDDDESVIQAPAQTYQVTRAKPQIMRVNTIRQQEENIGGLKRSGSTRTILTKESERPSSELMVAASENPFDDQHRAASNKPTDSILSSAGDGEITVIWDGK